MIDEKAIRQLAGIVVGLLVDGEYQALENMTQRERLTADHMRIAVEEYGRTLVYLPAESRSLIQIFEIDNSNPPAVFVDVPLWTVEEGRSDLAVELRMIERQMGFLDVELMNIYVP